MKLLGNAVCKYRKIILIIALILLIPAIIGMKSTRINYDILVYLPENIETVQGEKILSEDFDMGGFSVIILENMKNKDILKLENKIKEIDNVEKVISAASCTTNCLAPVLKVLNDNFGIRNGYMTTVHAYTNDQATLDVAHKKGYLSRRGRAAAANVVPATTGAASAIGLVIPELKGKLDGIAMRVPVTTGSVIDLTLELNRNVTEDEINNLFMNNQNETIKYTTDPVVSIDIIVITEGALVDGLLTNVLESEGKQLVKIVAWYDNEMSYSAQMVRTAKKLANV